ncbi:hypothetical protein SDC9_156690 [bioreactor metagenome]|uniref:DUF1795 domain-containing protein n=1 Tax=bioreactor metagenome TaxID=1076179 RepID=A0A645F699_9ZZZZ
MKYSAQEFEIDLPQPFRDQTVNALLLGDGSLPSFNLVVSRDVLPKNETLASVVKKQLQVIAGQDKFKEMEPQKPRQVPLAGGGELSGIEIFVRFKNGGNIIYQKHLYVLPDEKRILIFVGTSRGLWEDKENLQWNNLMSSVSLKP